MGKKILIGCLVLGLIGVIAGGIGLYYFVYRPAKEYVASLSEVSQVVELNDQVDNQAPYSPPADNLLTQEQVDRFVRVQRQMVAQLGSLLKDLNDKYQGYGGPEGRQVGLTELFGLWSDLKTGILRAKQIQVEAINQEGLSLEEYRWIRANFYQALGATFLSINVERIAEAVQQQNPELLRDAQAPELAPEANRQLVEPYREEAGQWLAYAWLGL